MAITEADRAAVSLTFTTRATIEGVTGDLVLAAPSLAEIRKALRAFPRAGIEPAPPAGLGIAPAQDIPPICSVHKKPMKPSKAPGQWFCSATLDDGTYCKEKRKAA